MISDADKLRTLDRHHEPDPRWSAFGIRDSPTTPPRPVTIEDHHRDIDDITLDPSVPEPVQEQFETTKNLALYSWYVYRFQTVAETHAYATLEYALRERVGRQNETHANLKTLLRRALGQGLIKDNDIQLFKQQARARAREGLRPAHRDRQVRVRNLIEFIPEHRNELAHGSEYLNNRAINTLQLCADIINTIYAPPRGKTRHQSRDESLP